MAKSKKAEMRQYWQENPGATSSEVAAEFDTNPSYARRCKPSELKGTTQNAPGREIEQALGDGGDAEPEQEQNPLSELVIEDTHDSYECSECDAEVDYLDDTCGNCGEQLIWARGVEA